MSEFFRVFHATFMEFLSGRTKLVLGILLLGWFLLFLLTTSYGESSFFPTHKMRVLRTCGIEIPVEDMELPVLERKKRVGFDRGSDFLIAIAFLTVSQMIPVILLCMVAAWNLSATLSKGTVEFVLTQPLSRWRFFIFKYISTLAFLLACALLFVLSNWLVAVIRLGEVNFSFVHGIPYLLLLYAPLVAFVYLFYGLTAKRGVALGATVAVFITASVLFIAHTYYEMVLEEANKYGGLEHIEEHIGWGMKTAVLFYHILPKVVELPAQSVAAVGMRSLVSGYAIWSTLLFWAAVLPLAVFALWRRDY